MKFIISGKNIEVTEGLRNAVQDKLSKQQSKRNSDVSTNIL